jgi:endogenous inhibitor of DNA gyrase (YacG/DUF329 family)
MGNEVQIPVALPLDDDGFLRRECPTCERELKWRPTPEGEQAVPPPDGGYFCPYCGVQAQPGTWLTKAQASYIEALAVVRVVDPMIQKFNDDLGRMARGSGGVISVRSDRRPAEEPEPLGEEVNEMRRVDFTCHRSEPVKVLDDWTGPVQCIICGQAVES